MKRKKMDNELIRKALSFVAIAIVSTAILLAMLPFGVEAQNVVVPKKDNPENKIPEIKLSKVGSNFVEVEINDKGRSGIQKIECGDLGEYTYFIYEEPKCTYPYNKISSQFNKYYKDSEFKATIFDDPIVKRCSKWEYKDKGKTIRTTKPEKVTMKFYSKSGGPIEFKLAALDHNEKWDIIPIRDECDYGDAPDPKYPSLYKNKGARHFDCSSEWLGKEVNKEKDSKQIKQDDHDDGVTFYPPYLKGTKNKVDVVITISKQDKKRYIGYLRDKRLYLDAWFDWNNDGKWNQSEKVITKSYNPSSSIWGKGNTSKTVTINITPPKNQPKNMWVRFRLSYGEGNFNRPFGVSLFGEVEDYNVSVNIKNYNPKASLAPIRKNVVKTQKACIGQNLQFIGFNAPPKIYKLGSDDIKEISHVVYKQGKNYFLFDIQFEPGIYIVNYRGPDFSPCRDAAFLLKIPKQTEEILLNYCEDGAYGDANGDGKIDDADLYYLWQIPLGYQPETTLSDANQDGVIDKDDMLYVAQIIETERLQYSLTSEISSAYVAQGDWFAIEGILSKSFENREVVMLGVQPQGDYWVEYLYIESEDGAFRGDIYVDKDIPVGYYDIYMLHPGIDKVWGTNGEIYLETVLDEYLGESVLETDEIQDDVRNILEDLIYDPRSDDLMTTMSIRIEEPYVELDPIEDVFVGEPLVVTGITNRQEGRYIVLTCKLCQRIVQVENATFRHVFDTTSADPGEYTIRAYDFDGYTDEATVNIWER